MKLLAIKQNIQLTFNALKFQHTCELLNSLNKVNNTCRDCIRDLCTGISRMPKQQQTKLINSQKS